MNLSKELKKAFEKNWLSKIQTLAGICSEFDLKPYLVGGAVRDLILSVPAEKDLDITFVGSRVPELASRLSSEWKAKLLSHPQFLTFSLHFEDGSIADIITARNETYGFPGALPEVLPGTLEQDLFRRDFSINAMALSLSVRDWGEVIDLHHGVEDLEQKKVRVLHENSFQDDPTRIFRAARFLQRLGFRMESGSEALLKTTVKNQGLKTISWDRVRIELEKILLEKKSAFVLEQLGVWNVWENLQSVLCWNEKSFKRMRLFDRVKETMNLNRTQNILFGLMFLVLEEESRPCELLMKHMNFPGSIQQKVLQTNRIFSALCSHESPVSVTRESLFPETERLFHLLIKQPAYKRFRKSWLLLHKWLNIHAYVTGEDLKKCGYLPGPQFKRILERIRSEKFRGKLKTKAEEIRFVVDNFRRA